MRSKHGFIENALSDGCWLSQCLDALQGVSLQDNAGESPYFFELPVGHQSRTGDRIGNSHSVVGDGKNGKAMVLQEGLLHHCQYDARTLELIDRIEMPVLALQAISAVTILNRRGKADRQRARHGTRIREYGQLPLVGGQTQFPKSRNRGGWSTRIIRGLTADSVDIESCAEV